MLEKVRVKFLVKRAKSGEKKAFEELYEIFADRAFKFIYLKLPTFFDAEDLMQEAFFRAFSQISSLKEESAFGSFLFSILKNLVSDFYKKRKEIFSLEDLKEKGIEVSVDFFDAENEPFDPPFSGSYFSETERSKEEAVELLSLLDEREREVLEQRYCMGLSILEVSENLGISTSSVKVICFRAKQKLKEKLNKKGGKNA